MTAPQDNISEIGGASGGGANRMLKIDGVCEFCGGVHARTIDRWMEADGFPRPRYIHNMRFWLFSEIQAWMERQPKEAATNETRMQIFSEGRRRGLMPEAREKAAATKRKGKNKDGEVDQ